MCNEGESARALPSVQVSALRESLTVDEDVLSPDVILVPAVVVLSVAVLELW